MNLAGLLFLLLAHYLSGRGILRLFRAAVRGVELHCLALMVGVPVVSLAPCVLQLLSVRITALPVIFSVVLLTAPCCLPLLLPFRRPVFRRLRWPQYYEWPGILAIAILMGVSVWRCFYYPPFSRDVLSGPELIAEYTIREGTMINSVFSVDLQTTNNYFKSPYITCLQIIYKLLVCPFGQLWLSVLAVSFIIWLYLLLRRRIHLIIAGLLLLFFIAIPDLYSYSYIILYDYSNMVFFFGGYYFLSRYLQRGIASEAALAALLFGLATYIRTETLVLVVLTLPLMLTMLVTKKETPRKVLALCAILVAIPAACYALCIHVFVHKFVPLPFNVAGQINPNLADISLLGNWLTAIGGRLIFAPVMLLSYGYFIYFFCVVLIADLFRARSMKREAVVMLYGIAVVYIGLALLGYLLPVVDLANTTKRGLFKLFPLMLLYLANSVTLQRISQLVKGMETGSPASTEQE